MLSPIRLLHARRIGSLTRVRCNFIFKDAGFNALPNGRCLDDVSEGSPLLTPGPGSLSIRWADDRSKIDPFWPVASRRLHWLPEIGFLETAGARPPLARWNVFGLPERIRVCPGFDVSVGRSTTGFTPCLHLDIFPTLLSLRSSISTSLMSHSGSSVGNGFPSFQAHCVCDDLLKAFEILM